MGSGWWLAWSDFFFCEKPVHPHYHFFTLSPPLSLTLVIQAAKEQLFPIFGRILAKDKPMPHISPAIFPVEIFPNHLTKIKRIKKIGNHTSTHCPTEINPAMTKASTIQAPRLNHSVLPLPYFNGAWYFL